MYNKMYVKRKRRMIQRSKKKLKEVKRSALQHTKEIQYDKGKLALEIIDRLKRISRCRLYPGL